jgi:hypothetical protein
MGQLRSLTALSVLASSNLVTIPDELSQLNNLQDLYISDCNNLTALPDAVWQLRSLGKLRLQGCSKVCVISEALGQLNSLRELALAKCSSLGCLPHMVGQLCRLETLNLSGCSALESVPGTVGQLTNLVRLDLQDCTSLSRVPAEIGQLISLQKLKMSGCSSLSSVANEVGSLTSLQLLDLTGCISLSWLPTTVGDLVSLDTLLLDNCYSLSTLPEAVGRLHSLVSLSLSGCTTLTRLPETLGRLHLLQSLYLWKCSCLTALPYNMEHMTSLSVLDLQSCNSLKGLLQDLVLKAAAVGSWPELNLSYCSEVASLAESVMRLSSMLIKAKARVRVRGWGGIAQGLTIDKRGYITMTVTAAQQLRRTTIVQQLLADRTLILDLLSRLSWMGVLLGAATFTAALAAPGQSEGKKDVSAFFALDLLSFGFSMVPVVFVVACSVPHTGRLSSRAEAGMIWLSLLLASLLLVLAVMCGMLALLFGVWDGFAPAGRELCVALPLAVCLVLTAMLCVLLVHCLSAVFPGGLALAAAAESVGAAQRWQQLQEVLGKCWKKLQQCWHSSNPALAGQQQQQQLGQQLQQVA